MTITFLFVTCPVGTVPTSSEYLWVIFPAYRLALDVSERGLKMSIAPYSKGLNDENNLMWCLCSSNATFHAQLGEWLTK